MFNKRIAISVIISWTMIKQPIVTIAKSPSGTLLLSTNNSYTNTEYQAEVKQIGSSKQLSEWFDNLDDLATHFKSQSNYRVDFNESLIEVLGKHPTKSSGTIHIANIKMSVKEKQQHEARKAVESLLQVVKRCTENEELSNQQTKQMLVILANRLSKFQEQAKQNTETINKLKQQLKEKDEMIQVIIKKLGNSSDGWDRRMEKIEDRFQAIEGKYGDFTSKIEKVASYQKAISFIDENCFGYRRISVKGNSVVKSSGNEADIFSKIKIKDKNSYAIRIDRLKEFMCIGIADSKLKTRSSFINEPNCLVYYSDGNFFNGKAVRNKITQPIKVGDTVAVIVDLVQGKIEWKVDGEVRISYNYDPIKDKDIEWVPYVWILEDQDGFTVIE